MTYFPMTLGYYNKWQLENYGLEELANYEEDESEISLWGDSIRRYECVKHSEQSYEMRLIASKEYYKKLKGGD